MQLSCVTWRERGRVREREWESERDMERERLSISLSLWERKSGARSYTRKRQMFHEYPIPRKRPNRIFFHRTEPNRIWKTFLPNRTEPNFGYRTEPNHTKFFLSKYFSKKSSKVPIKVFRIILKVCEKNLKKISLKFIQFSWSNWKKMAEKARFLAIFWTKNSVVRSKFSTEPNRTFGRFLSCSRPKLTP